MKKKKTKKQGIIFFVICCIVGIGSRIYWVNKEVEKKKITYFQTKETVEFGQDFTMDSSRIIDGYTVEVLDSEVLSTKDFYKKYNIVIDEEEVINNTFVKYYYVVKAVFFNRNNQNLEERGIDLSNIFLIGKDYSVVVNQMTYERINPNMPQGLGFSLLPDSSTEVLLPYAIIPSNIAKNEKAAYQKLTEDVPMIQITAYPTKKLIQTR